MDKAYESIIDVIKDRTEKKGYETIDFYEAVKIAYTDSKYMQKNFDSEIKDTTKINKGFIPIWKFTYKIVNEEKNRVKVVNKDTDNLLVQWVHGGKTIIEILKAMNTTTRST
jgi:uncharacterized protein YegL